MNVLYWILQWTWGLPQTLAGAVLAFEHRSCEHAWERGALVTYWQHASGLSLGMFTFVPMRAGVSYKSRVAVHEYGHTLQSIMLGPLYLFVVGVPSAIWANSSRALAYRKRSGKSYYSFWCEKWANALGERALGKPAPRE